MLDFNEKTATEGVLKSFSSIKNERLKYLCTHQIGNKKNERFVNWSR